MYNLLALYNLLTVIRRDAPLYLISVINSGDWVWVQLDSPRFQGHSTTLRFRKNDNFKPHSLLLEVNDEEVSHSGNIRSGTDRTDLVPT